LHPNIEGDKISKPKNSKKDLPIATDLSLKTKKRLMNFTTYQYLKYNLKHSNVDQCSNYITRLFICLFLKEKRTKPTQPIAVDTGFTKQRNDPILRTIII
jgi:hypothetical protein